MTVTENYDTRTGQSPSLGELINAGDLERYRRRALHQCGDLHPDDDGSYCRRSVHGADAHHRGMHYDGVRHWPQILDGGDIERGGEPAEEKRADDAWWPSPAVVYCGTQVDVDATGAVAVIQ